MPKSSRPVDLKVLKSINFTPQQVILLSRFERKWEMSQSEIVRRALDEFFWKHVNSETAPVVQARAL